MIVLPPRNATAHLDRPLYSYEEADHLAGLGRGTARRWLEGYAYTAGSGERVLQPAITNGRRSKDEPGVSFLELVELVAIGRLKGLGFTLPQIRRIAGFCRKRLGTDYPFASPLFKTDGRDIFVGRPTYLLDVLRRKGAQAWNEVLAPFLESLDYQDDLARRWWPLGKAEPVIVDPDYGFGLPVVAGSGVRTEIVLERFRAGDRRDEIARDFNLTPDQVERALQFEVARLAA
jgi:uncharacterized protein (DUF433 family)